MEPGTLSSSFYGPTPNMDKVQHCYRGTAAKRQTGIYLESILATRSLANV
jgi:hypothetical protein